MKSNQKTLLGGFIASLMDRIPNLNDTEHDALAAVSADLTGRQSDAERFVPSEEAMTREGWKPVKEGTLSSRSDDTRGMGKNTNLPNFRTGSQEGRRDEQEA